MSRWDQGLDVVVEGEAIQITGEDTLKRLAAAFTMKWDGRWQFEVHDGSFHHPGGGPIKVFAHAKGDPFGATTYKF
jgi:hypothetical protein